MTEIQLRQIVDRLSLEKKNESTDGQESMHKNGRTTSKFCKEAMTNGEDVDKIRLVRVLTSSSRERAMIVSSPQRIVAPKFLRSTRTTLILTNSFQNMPPVLSHYRNPRPPTGMESLPLSRPSRILLGKHRLSLPAGILCAFLG